jgi:excisionase family DNA binding protein
MIMDQKIGKLTLSVEEARRLLGLSRGLMYKAIKRGEIPHIKVGKRILIPIGVFINWLKESNH